MSKNNPENKYEQRKIVVGSKPFSIVSARNIFHTLLVDKRDGEKSAQRYLDIAAKEASVTTQEVVTWLRDVRPNDILEKSVQHAGEGRNPQKALAQANGLALTYKWLPSLKLTPELDQWAQDYVSWARDINPDRVDFRLNVPLAYDTASKTFSLSILGWLDSEEKMKKRIRQGLGFIPGKKPIPQVDVEKAMSMLVDVVGIINSANAIGKPLHLVQSKAKSGFEIGNAGSPRIAKEKAKEDTKEKATPKTSKIEKGVTTLRVLKSGKVSKSHTVETCGCDDCFLKRRENRKAGK